MSADASAMTLADYALISNDPLTQKISFSLLQYGNVLQDIPLITRASMKASGTRYQDNLASVGWRALNEAPTVVKSTPTPWEEQAFILSNSFEVDHYILEDQNQITNPFSTQLMAYLKAVTYDFNDKFINNNHVTGDDDAVHGLRYRLDNPTTFKLASACKLDAGGADLTTAMTATTANNFFEKLDELLYTMGAVNGDGVILYLNGLLERRINRAARVLGGGAGFRTDVDAVGRQVGKYRNATFRIIGPKSDQSTEIITSTETAAGADGASTFTSLYAAKYGMEDAFFGWQFKALDQAINGPYYKEDGTMQKMVVDWAVGLFQENNRAIGRMYDIKMS